MFDLPLQLTGSHHSDHNIFWMSTACHAEVCFLLLRFDGIALPTLPLIGWCLLPLVGLVAFYAFTSALLFSVFDVNPNLKMQHVCVGGWHQVDIGISHQHHFHFPPEFQPVFNVGGWYKAGDALWHQSIIQHVSDVSLDVKPTFGFDMNQIFIYD